MKQRNACRLVGDVTEIDLEAKTVTMLTKQERPSGVYEDSHIVRAPDLPSLKKIKVGQRLEVLGQLGNIPGESYSTRLEAVIWKRVPKNTGYANEVQLVGTIPYSAAMLPAAEGKTSLVNLSIEVAGKIFYGVAFRQLAAVFNRVWSRGNHAMLGGRLRRREFLDNNGDLQTAVEIVVEDAADTKVLRRMTPDDKFGDFGLIKDQTEEAAV